MTDDLMPGTPKPAPRRFRRLRIGALIGLGAVAAGLAFLPALLETGPARAWIVARINDRLAPGRVGIEAFDFSWTGPTRIRRLRLFEPGGEVVVEADSARLDRSLWSLIRRPNAPSTLVLENARFDIERDVDGEVDLLNAVARLFEGDPRTKPATRIEALDAEFHIVTSELEPIDGRGELVLDFPPHGEPLTWQLGLRELTPDMPATLGIDGSRERPVPGHDGPLRFAVTLSAGRWPLGLHVGGRTVTLQMDGHQNVGFDPQFGGYRTDGNLDLRELVGPGLEGLPDLRIESSYEVADLEAGSEQPHVLRVIAYTNSPVTAESLIPGFHLGLTADHDPGADRIVIREATIRSGEQTLEVAGQASGLKTDAPAFEVSATTMLHGDWLDRIVTRALGLETRIEGERIDAQLSGPLEASARIAPLEHWTLAARLSADGLDALGLTTGPFEIAARTEGGEIRLAPIETTLNNGRVRLLPRLIREGDGRFSLGLEEGSAIDGAEVNEQLSREVLAFAVPVLERATHPTGRVSTLIERATIPIGPGSEGRSPDVRATIVFDQVEFGPGPLARSILGVINREDATLRLDQPVVAWIADRRVRTEGFAIPIGNVTAFELEGSVGFDRSLDLVARLPITREMLGNVPIVSDLFGDLAIEVPIGGELGDAKLDKIAFNEQLRGLAAELARRGSRGGLNGVFDLLGRIRDRRIERRESMRPGPDSPR